MQSPTHIFVGRAPDDIRPGDEVLMKVWPDGSAELAIRRFGRDSSWGPPVELDARPTE